MKRWYRGAACAIVLFCSGTAPFAQGDAPGAENAETVFSRATDFYRAGDFDSVVVTIREFLKTNGKDPAAEQCVPLIMEALARENDFATLQRLFDLYGKKYPSSVYMPRVCYLHGFSCAKQRSWNAAFASFSKALRLGVSGDLDSLIMKNCEAVCANALDVSALRAAGADTSLHPRIREIVRYGEIKKLADSGDYRRARTCFGEFGAAYPGSRFETRLSALLAAEPPQNQFAIGILAPLSGEDLDLGRRVVQGVRLAIDRYNSRHARRIDAIMYDTRGSLIETARKTLELLDRDRVPVIVGPALSSTATVAAAMLLGRETVMLTPTATDDGIAGLNPRVFQINITLGILARSLARYACTNLNIREFAVVAPRTPYGSSMSVIFRDEVIKSGGTVFDEEFFEEGGNDFTAQFVNLRKKLLLRKINDAAKAADEGYKPVTVITPSDSAKWADSSVSIGAIFMPADADDVIMLAPQVAFNRIKTQLLGSNGWRSPKTLAEGKKYVQNAIISTPFEPDSSWKKWPDFRKEYAGQFREEPDRVAALGFDAGTVAAAALEKNTGDRAGTAARITESIAATQKFEGVSGIITIDRNSRTNSEAVILKITPNGFVRVQ
jgi:ABC-type branched-subunit amino acid transport system substrate-binding protein